MVTFRAIWVIHFSSDYDIGSGNSLHRKATSHPDFDYSVSEGAVDQYLQASILGAEDVRSNRVPDFKVRANYAHNLLDKFGVDHLNAHDSDDNKRIFQTVARLLPYALHDTVEEADRTANFYTEAFHSGASSLDQDSAGAKQFNQALRNLGSKVSTDSINKIYAAISHSFQSNPDTREILSAIFKNASVDPILVSKEALKEVDETSPGVHTKHAALMSPFLPEDVRARVIRESLNTGDTSTLKVIMDNTAFSDSDAEVIYHGTSDADTRANLLLGGHLGQEYFDDFMMKGFSQLSASQRTNLIQSPKASPQALKGMFEHELSGESFNTACLVLRNPNVNMETLELASNNPDSNWVRRVALTSDSMWDTVLPQKLKSGVISDDEFLTDYTKQRWQFGPGPKDSYYPKDVEEYFASKYEDPMDGEKPQLKQSVDPDLYTMIYNSKRMSPEIKTRIESGILKLLDYNVDTYGTNGWTLGRKCPSYLNNLADNIILNSRDVNPSFIEEFTK